MKFFFSVLLLVLWFVGCSSSQKNHSSNDANSSTDGVIDNEGIKESDATVVSNDDTNSENPVSCPPIDLPARLRDQDTGKIATLTRLSAGGKCGVHLASDFFNGDLWGNDSPFTADPDIFGDVTTLYRVSDNKWKLINDLVGEEYASVLEVY